MKAQRVRGFTLIEMAVTAAIIALLSTIAFPMAELAYQRSKERELRSSLWQIREAVDAYKRAWDDGHILNRAGESGYPPSLKILADGVEDAKSPAVAKPRLYFLRRIPRDPFSNDRDIPAEKTWGLRSYESSGSDPKPGKDVYDIYSMTAGTGLNGVAYREW
ncbi:MAG: type II secretion system protein [Gallionella sp.]|nr:type II secretion system protein [Gallionella sp.]MDP1939482.1 type II secretion system protein [Gallionella sp.]